MLPRRIDRRLFIVALAVALHPAVAFAQAPPPAQPSLPPPPGRLVAQPPEIAAARARWEGRPEAEVTSAGYTVSPNCVSAVQAGLPAALGNMGYHAQHAGYWGTQFPAAAWEPQNPPLLLLDATKRVVGVEWEAAGALRPAPSLAGHAAVLMPGHPGVPAVNAPHYMLHFYFKPNATVWVDVYDPDLTCPTLAAAAPQPAPTSPASALPRTGGLAVELAVLASLGLVGVGAALRRLGSRARLTARRSSGRGRTSPLDQ